MVHLCVDAPEIGQPVDGSNSARQPQSVYSGDPHASDARDTGKTAWYIDEFGAVLPIVVLAFATYFWRTPSELTVP
jgi:hypothetical protein